MRRHITTHVYARISPGNSSENGGVIAYDHIDDNDLYVPGSSEQTGEASEAIIEALSIVRASSYQESLYTVHSHPYRSGNDPSGPDKETAGKLGVPGIVISWDKVKFYNQDGVYAVIPTLSFIVDE